MFSNVELLGVFVLVSERVKYLFGSIVDIALNISLVLFVHVPLFGGGTTFAAGHRLMITLHNPSNRGFVCQSTWSNSMGTPFMSHYVFVVN